MTGLERIFKRGKVWWVAYYPERLAMTQLGLRRRSMFDRYQIVSDANAARAQ
jgi:hypothetical protein